MNEPIYTMTEAALYDLLASTAAAASDNTRRGWQLPPTREEMIEELREGFPPYLLRSSVAYSMAGRPEGAAKIAGIEADIASALAHGNEGLARSLQDTLSAEKAAMVLGDPE